MRLIKSRKWRTCKRCNNPIYSGAMYWPQRRGKAICVECAHKPKYRTFIDWLLGKLA